MRGTELKVFNDRKSYNRKQIRNLLLTVTLADPKRFTVNVKSIIHTKEFFELYYRKNYGKVYQFYGIEEFERWRVSIAKHSRNLGTYQMIEISTILYSAHVIPRNQDGNVLYINKYIDRNQFNQLYAPNLIKQRKKYAEAVA